MSYQVQTEYCASGKDDDDLGPLDGAVLCAHDDSDSPRAKIDAELHAAMRNTLPGLLDALDKAEAERLTLASVLDVLLPSQLDHAPNRVSGTVSYAVATLARSIAEAGR